MKEITWSPNIFPEPTVAIANLDVSAHNAQSVNASNAKKRDPFGIACCESGCGSYDMTNTPLIVIATAIASVTVRVSDRKMSAPTITKAGYPRGNRAYDRNLTVQKRFEIANEVNRINYA